MIRIAGWYWYAGKGPRREMYERKIAEQNQRMQQVKIITAWLAAEDYPRLLGEGSDHTTRCGYQS